MKTGGWEPEDVQEILLERVPVGLSDAVGTHVLDSVRTEAELERHFDRMALRLRAELLVEKLPTERIIRSATKRIPASPWQAWKEAHQHARWYPYRLLRPVRYQVYGLEVTVDVGRYRAFPKADVVYPESLGQPLRFVMPTTSIREYAEGYPDLE